jgi:hypothetical protein
MISAVFNNYEASRQQQYKKEMAVQGDDDKTRLNNFSLLLPHFANCY